MNAAQRAMERLVRWTELEYGSPSCGTGTALRAGGREIVHFHSDRDADLYLTAGPIQRLWPELDHSTALRLHPDSPWVTVHLDCGGDADLLVSLVSVALKANAADGPGAGSRVGTVCNLARVDVLSRRHLGGAAPEGVGARSSVLGRARAHVHRPGQRRTA
jgi:hypothetical protein